MKWPVRLRRRRVALDDGEWHHISITAAGTAIDGHAIVAALERHVAQGGKVLR